MVIRGSAGWVVNIKQRSSCKLRTSGQSLQVRNGFKIGAGMGYTMTLGFSMAFVFVRYRSNVDCKWLVVTRTWVLFFHSVGNVLIPIDELIFFGGV